jgi:hypothetical protein
MDARAILTRGVTTGLRLGRGTADRVITLAGPPLGRLTDNVVSRMRGSQQHGPTTFTPSRRDDETKTEPPAPANGPSPAVVARNIGPQRPTAKPARPARPKSVPGAKLPPPRPSTS